MRLVFREACLPAGDRPAEEDLMAKKEKDGQEAKPRKPRNPGPAWLKAAKALAKLDARRAEIIADLSEEDQAKAERLAKDIAAG